MLYFQGSDGRVEPKYLSCIFRAQMERLSEEGILSKLLVSFSRDGRVGPKYLCCIFRAQMAEMGLSICVVFSGLRWSV